MEKITSRRNPLAIHFRKLGARRDYREQHREFLCDGLKLLEEAVKSGAEIVAVLTSSHIPFPLPVETRVYHASRDIIDSLSPLKNAQDTLFTCKMPPPGGNVGESVGDNIGDNDGSNDSDNSDNRNEQTSILLDGIQDPGNLGTIVRTADAFDIKSVILTGNCADIYNPKTIRATMGAVFRQKTLNMEISELMALKNSGIVFIGADSAEGGKTIHDVALKGAVVAIGNEGRGLSEEILALCDEVFTIPTAPRSESLNAAVAASIAMWEASACALRE